MSQTATKPKPKIPDHSEATTSGDVRLETVFPRLFALWGRRRFIGKAAIGGLLAGSLLAFVLPSRYESTTRLMPPDNSSSSGSGMLGALMAINSANGQAGMGPRTSPDLTALANEALGMKSTGALFTGILRSQTVEDRLVDRFDLRKVYSVRYEQDARKKLEKSTTISEDRKSGIISITVTDDDPKRAAALAQANVDELDVLVAQLSTSTAHRERVFLERRLASVKNDLEDASKNFSQFSSKNRTIDLKDEARAILQNSAVIEGQLIAAESELEGLKTIFSDENVRVRAAQAQVIELRRQLEKMGGRAVVENGQAEKSTDDSALPSIRSLPIIGATYADLNRRVRLEEVVFEALTQQYELVKVQEAKETPSVKVLDPANFPERRSFPPRLPIILGCGLVAAIGAALFLRVEERWIELDANDPSKVFVEEIAGTVNAKMPWTTPNDSRFHQMAHWVWVRIIPHANSEGGEDRR